MEKKEMTGSTSSRRLLPPLYPGSPTATTNVIRAGNSNHQYYSRRHPSQHKPAAATHLSTQAVPVSQAHQLPPSPLAPTTHPSDGSTAASVGGSSITVSGSGCAAGSSSHQAPPSLLPQTHPSVGVSGGIADGGSLADDASQVSLPGSSSYQMPAPPSSPALDPVAMLGGWVDRHGTFRPYPTFLSSLDTGLASVVGLTPFIPSVDLPASSCSSPPPLLTQSTASVDFGSTGDYELPPLPPCLSGLTPLQPEAVVDLEAVRPDPAYIPLVVVDDDDEDSGNKVVPFVDLEAPGDGLNSSGHNTGTSTSIRAPCPPLASPGLSLHAFADALVKKEVVDWSSRGTSQLGSHNIASRSSFSFSPVNNGNGITQAPWTPALASSSSTPPPAANVQVKQEAVDWSWNTSMQRGKNPITSGGNSSTLMPQPYSSTKKVLTVFGRKRNLLPSLQGTGRGSSDAAGGSIGGLRGNSSQLYREYCASDPFVVDFADGLFTQSDITEIAVDKELSSLVLTEPKRVRSILKNRRDTEISNQRKRMYVPDLEHKVEQLDKGKKIAIGTSASTTEYNRFA